VVVRPPPGAGPISLSDDGDAADRDQQARRERHLHHFPPELISLLGSKGKPPIIAAFEAWRRREAELAPVTGLLGIRPVAIGDGTASS
jgi:hypothetical protein